MRLLKSVLNHFRGIHSKTIVYDGENTTILAENGKGKTSILDSVTWVFFDKDSRGNSKFDLRPHDKNENLIPKLVVSVEHHFDNDGDVLVFKKQNHERLNGGEIVGYTNKYWINDVPMTEAEFNNDLKKLAPKEVLKMCVDPKHFNRQDKKKKRDLLLLFAEDIGIPVGFDDLINDAKGKGIDGYKKVLDERKKLLVKEYKTIQPRIDENALMLKDFKDDDVTEIKADRESITLDLQSFQMDRNYLTDNETDRQKLLGEKNKLNGDKIKREAVLSSDTSGVQRHIDEKARTNAAIEERKTAVISAKGDIARQQTVVGDAETTLQAILQRKAGISEEYDTLKNVPMNGNCPTCDQVLPAGSITKIKQRRQDQLNSIAVRGKNEFKKSKEQKTIIASEKQKLSELETVLEQKEVELQESIMSKNERFNDLNRAINANVTIAPEADDEWCEICNKISELENRIGDPVNDQLAEIDKKIAGKNQELADLNTKLANFDNATKARKRIAKLSERETEIGQQTANVDAGLQRIEDYKTTQNRMIEESVNGMFKHVRFRLFTTNLSGGTNDDCTPIYIESGTDYLNSSCGESIVIDSEINRIVKKHYGFDFPLFIDSAGELTKEIDIDSQVIRLVAKKGQKELFVTKDN